MKGLEAELKAEVIELIKSNFTVQDISDKTGVSISTICRYRKNLGVAKARKKSKVVSVENINTEKKNTSNVEKKSVGVDDNIIVVKNKVLEVAMITDRHKMPVSRGIFEGPVKDIFNYAAMDSVVSEFIVNNINFVNINGEKVADTDLVVYVTGLSPAMASIIKMCSIYNINLSLMHYNESDNKYYGQKIFSRKNNPYDYLTSIFDDNILNGTIIFHGISNTTNVKNLVIIKKVEYINKVPNQSIHVYKTEQEAFENYVNMQIKISNNKNYIMLTMERGEIKNNKYNSIKTLLKSCNQ